MDSAKALLITKKLSTYQHYIILILFLFSLKIKRDIKNRVLGKTKTRNNIDMKKEWIEKGFVDEQVDASLDLKKEIRNLCKEKDAIILAHYYTVGDIQDIADFVGDSLALARKAAETDAKVMVMCGVHFMAETCKLLSPDKTVLCPDLTAGCSLADSCRAEDLKKFKDEHPGYKV